MLTTDTVLDIAATIDGCTIRLGAVKRVQDSYSRVFADWDNLIRMEVNVPDPTHYDCPIVRAGHAWVMLHELGHVAHRHTRLLGITKTPEILQQEQEAWVWAFDQVPLDDVGKRVIEWALGSYIHNARRWSRRVARPYDCRAGRRIRARVNPWDRDTWVHATAWTNQLWERAQPRWQDILPPLPQEAHS